MTARDHMSLPTEYVVCEALMALAVTGTERQAETSILAMHELGYGDAAAHLDSAISYRRELSTEVGDHSVRAADRVVLHLAIGRCPCGLIHEPAEAFRLNREAIEDVTRNGTNPRS